MYKLSNRLIIIIVVHDKLFDKLMKLIATMALTTDYTHEKSQAAARLREMQAILQQKYFFAFRFPKSPAPPAQVRI